MPPAPGMIASRVSGRPTSALALKTRNVVERASSRPPPRATEETDVSVGIGRAEMRFSVERREVRNWFVLKGENNNCFS